MVSVQRHLAVLRSELRADEIERLWIRAERLPQGHAGALLVTDRRLLFCGLGFVQQSQGAWPLSRIQVEPRRGADLVLRVGADQERFTGRSRDLGRVADLLVTIEPIMPRSTVEDLERLAALHRDGSLTDEEFALAKRRLLG